MSARHLGTLQTLLPFLAILIMIRNSVASALSPDPVQVISSGASKVVMDGDFLITAHIDVTVWDNTVDVGAKIKEFTSGYDMPIVAMSALQGFLYTVASNGPKSIRKWNYTTGSLLWSSPASGDSHRVMVTDLLVNGTSVFYTSYSDGTIKRWDVLTGAFQATVHEMRDMDISKFSVPIHKMYFGSDATKLFASVGRYGPGNNDLPMWRSDFEGNVDLDSGMTCSC